MDDLASSSASVFLDGLVTSGAIPPATCEAYKAKYGEVFRLAHNAVEREKDLVAKARDLRALVREEQIAVEKARARKEQLVGLNEEAEAERKRLSALVSELESRDSAMQVDMNDLRLVESELTADVAALRKENEAVVTPHLAAMMDEIAETRGEYARAVATAESLMSGRTELEVRSTELEAQVLAARATANAMRMEHTRVKGDPERAQKAVDSVRRAVSGLSEEVSRARAAIAAREAELADQRASIQAVASAKQELDMRIAKYHADIAARAAEVREVEERLRSQRIVHKELLESRITMQHTEAATQAAARAAEMERDAMAAAYERAKRDLKRKLDGSNEIVATQPTVSAAVAEQRMELARLRAEAEEMDKRIHGGKRDIEGLMASFLKCEGVERRHKEEAEGLVEACDALEEEKEHWHKEEQLAMKQVSALKAQRDIKSRELAKLVSSRKATIEASKTKELQLVDLTKQLGDINTRLRQFAAMYDVVKNERNTFANQIQTASQGIAEMRERIKILHNEVDILHNESNAKDKALAKERQAHAVAAVQRDALRAEANKCSLTYREKQRWVESQINAIDKLNSIINGLERDMMALKREYETAVETRNYSGIQLIDRNDELCILYEKSNIHEKTLGDGERSLRVMGDEIRGLRMAAAELERQLHIARCKFPETPAWAERILDLQRQLVQARAVTERMCIELETPSGSDRWVELGGEDPDIDSLKLRLNALEARVSVTREEGLERDLVLEEVTSMTEKLRAAATGASSSAALAATESGGATRSTADAPGVALTKQANDLASKIKDTNRRMMAVVSELSMYQATAIKLATEATSAQEALTRATEAFTAGQPPSLAALHKWQSMERARSLPRGAATVKINPAFVDGPKTTAEPRPNAYIPEGIGLPKPYGEFAPFKPAESGAIMRFYRNPESKEIEL